jgi:predicted enzyme related to lactoylglutathione lyase
MKHNSEVSSSRTSVRVAVLVALLAGLGLGACAKQIIVPKLTPEPTQLELYGKFVWFDLFTDDLESASRFYEALFGWSFIDTTPETEAVKTILRDGIPIANGAHITPKQRKKREKEEKREKKEKKTSESRWLGYMSVADVDGAARQVEQSGGSVYIEPKDLPERGRIAVVIDPEGAIFAIVRASDGDPPDQGVLENHWLGSELWTTNPDGAQAFYSSLVGYEQQLVDVGSDSAYRLLVKDERPRAGIVKIPWDDVEPDWVPYVAVSDTAAIVEKAVKLGARVLIEPEGTNQPGAIAIIADPSGAVFAVQQF